MIAIMLTPMISAMAQPGLINQMDLSEEQQEQLKEMRVEHMKIVTPKKDRIGVLKAEFREALNAGDKAKLQNLIDEETKLHKELKEEFVAHQLAIKEVLSEEQWLIWTSRDRGPKARRDSRPGNGAGPANRSGGAPGPGKGLGPCGGNPSEL